MNAIGEHDLHRYLDGEMNPADAAAFEAWLAQNPDAAATLEAYRQQIRSLHRAFDGVLDEPLPAPLAEAARPGRRREPWLRMAASLLLLLVGGAGGWWLNNALTAASPIPGWVVEGTEAHKLYAGDARAVEISAGDEFQLVSWINDRFAQKVRRPLLTEQGYFLIGGRLLPSRTGPAAQFMYENMDGGRMTLYLKHRPGNASASAEPRLYAENGISAITWSKGDMLYALIGMVPQADLTGGVRNIQAQFAQ